MRKPKTTSTVTDKLGDLLAKSRKNAGLDDPPRDTHRAVPKADPEVVKSFPGVVNLEENPWVKDAAARAEAGQQMAQSEARRVAEDRLKFIRRGDTEIEPDAPEMELVPPREHKYPLELVAGIAVHLVASVNRAEASFGGMTPRAAAQWAIQLLDGCKAELDHLAESEEP